MNKYETLALAKIAPNWKGVGNTKQPTEEPTVSVTEVIKPKAYAHLSDYQYALQQVLNSLCIFISVNGKKLSVEKYMPLSISQILCINKLYNIENTISEGNTNYIININSNAIEKITMTDTTLADIIAK